MDADEVLLWRSWLCSEPRGERRRDFHAAQVSQSVYTVLASLVGEKPPSLKDNLISFEGRKVDPKTESMRNAQAALRAFGITPDNGLEKLREDMRKLREVD